MDTPPSTSPLSSLPSSFTSLVDCPLFFFGWRLTETRKWWDEDFFPPASNGWSKLKWRWRWWWRYDNLVESLDRSVESDLDARLYARLYANALNTFQYRSIYWIHGIDVVIDNKPPWNDECIRCIPLVGKRRDGRRGCKEDTLDGCTIDPSIISSPIIPCHLSW